MGTTRAVDLPAELFPAEVVSACYMGVFSEGSLGLEETKGTYSFLGPPTRSQHMHLPLWQVHTNQPTTTFSSNKRVQAAKVLVGSLSQIHFRSGGMANAAPSNGPNPEQ